ncbi:10724_t:CDS:2, partial [Gigaspora margarita]
AAWDLESLLLNINELKAKYIDKHIVLIVNWINDISNLIQSNFYTFNLLQQVSKHGSSSKKFYAQYDNKGATLLIIHIKDIGKILGKYNPID